GALRPRLPPPPDRRGQRGRPSEADDHGASSHLADHRRQARSRALGAGFLRRVRRPTQEARDRQGHGRVTYNFSMRRLIVIALAVVALAGGLPWAAAPDSASSVARAQTPDASLVDLHSPSELRTAFNRDQGKVRIVLLVSPT